MGHKKKSYTQKQWPRECFLNREMGHKFHSFCKQCTSSRSFRRKLSERKKFAEVRESVFLVIKTCFVFKTSKKIEMAAFYHHCEICLSCLRMSFDFLVVKLADTSCTPYLQLKYTSSEAASIFSEFFQWDTTANAGLYSHCKLLGCVRGKWLSCTAKIHGLI